ncbi:MAG: type I DNA topoisomerase [Planctomycetes bacterium]|nr:type I DNA topoisomerase [Planctomycetota bacterium]
MGKSLVIVESPAKAKTINKFLGSKFVVKASMGHVRDLPKKKLGIDVEHDFAPEYIVIRGRGKTVSDLRKTAEKADAVYLAPDPDREGEAIAWHLLEALKIPAEKAHRVTFNEITKKAIEEAFKHPRAISMDKVNAQQARRVLDRLVGYQLSPLLWKKVARGLSAGRVQSVAVKLIVQREREIRAFVSEEYWKITATLKKGDPSAVVPRIVLAGTPDAPVAEEPLEPDAFLAELEKLDGQPFQAKTGDEAKALVEELRGAAYVVRSVERKETDEKAPPPFITSTLQQQGSIRLHYSAKKTMMLAQQLYEGVEIGSEGAVGLITYMRTDSTSVSQEAIGEIRKFIPERFGAAYLPDTAPRFKARAGAQEAHEAVRPTSVYRTPADMKSFLTGDQFRLYELIWKRFVASQMKPARIAVTTVQVEAKRGTFVARGREILFDGHTVVSGTRSADDEPVLPSMREGERLALVALAPTQHFTKPPARYTEATLVKALEKRGIGRPSTYAPIISTIEARNYVRKEKRKFFATDLGEIVTDRLEAHFPHIMDVEFTKRMEGELDEIEDAKANWVAVLREFYTLFQDDLKRAYVEMKGDVPEEKCEKCGKPMAIKFSRHGKFLACTGYPECKSSRPLEGPRPAPEATDKVCEKCGKPMVIKTGRRGRFLACSGYPECKNARNLDGEGPPPPRETDIVCEKCGKPMVIRTGKRGEFLACTGYPKCKNAMDVDEKGQPVKPEITDEKCPKCGSPMAIKRGPRGRFFACTAYPKCRGSKPIPGEEPPKPELSDKVCDDCGKPMAIKTGRRGKFLACTGYPKCKNTMPYEAPSGGSPQASV